MTKILVGGRGSGKTETMLSNVESLPDPSNAIILCHSAMEAARIGVLYNERNPGKPLPRFVTAEGARKLRGSGWPVYVDNADVLIAGLIGRIPEYVTMNGTAV